jgi:parallel beta-helix repeat protein
VSGGVAYAATYYVSKSGNDGNSCAQAQSLATPKLTINAGVGCVAAGDTLLIRAGNYNEGLQATFSSGTSWTNMVRIASYPGDTVWMKPLSNATSAGGLGFVILLDANVSYIEFDGINLDGTNLSNPVFWPSTNNGNNPHHIRLKNAEVIAGAIGGSGAVISGGHTLIGAIGSNEFINLTIHGGGLPGLCGYQCNSYGIYVAGPNNLVDGCNIYNTSAAGIQVYNASGDPPNGNVIRNTRIHDITTTGSLNQVWGIMVAGNNTQLYNDIIWNIKIGANNPGNAGITIGDGQSNNLIANNTIYNDSNTGIYVGNGSSNTVQNNIVYQVTGSPYIDTGSGTVQATNLFGVNPLFVSPPTNNFQLQSASPAINAGTPISVVTTDINGVPRPQGSPYTIGAYQYSSGSSSTPAAPTNVRIVPN